MVLILGNEGKSIEQMGHRIGVHVDTMYEWINVHPDFSEALRLAVQAEQAYWEELAREALHMPASSFPAALWSRSMAARFPAKYRERSEMGVGGAAGMPPVVTATVTQDQMAAYQELLARINKQFGH